jgi:hypothetical protein
LEKQKVPPKNPNFFLEEMIKFVNSRKNNEPMIFLVDLHNMDKLCQNGKCVEVTTTTTIARQPG